MPVNPLMSAWVPIRQNWWIGGETSDDGMIFNQDVSGQGGSVGQDDLISDLTVVGHMRIGHDEIVVADDGLSPSVSGASVEGDEFPNDILIADQKGGLLPLVGKGLGGFSDRCELKDLAPLPDLGSLPDDHMGPDPGPLADRDPAFNRRYRDRSQPLRRFRPFGSTIAVGWIISLLLTWPRGPPRPRACRPRRPFP